MISLDPYKLIYIDIETVSQAPTLHELPVVWQDLWAKKAKNLNKIEQPLDESYRQNAAIYAEFGKIICISLGIFSAGIFKIKSFYGDNESALLIEFIELLKKVKVTTSFCGHNIKEFDLPYIGRRLLANSITLPKLLDIQGLKPWEITHVDTMQLWKFGDYKNYTSLDLLAHVLDVPTSKNDIDGSLVGQVYWLENGLQRIVEYCQRDVLATANVYLRMNQMPLIDTEVIVIGEQIK